MPGFIVGSVGDQNTPANTIETLRNHRWRIARLGPVSRFPLVLAKELQLPESLVDKQEILGGLIVYKYAKSVNWPDLRVTLYDDGEVTQELQKWKDQVYESDSGIKLHNNYKQNCRFELLDGTGVVVIRVTLSGAWPYRISHGDLSFTNSEIKIVTVTLSYDDAQIEKQD